MSHGADRQGDIDRWIDSNLQHQASLHVFAEAFLGDFQPIRPDRQIGQCSSSPSCPLVTVRTAPVAVCVSLISAPATAPPLGSWIVPLIWEVEIVCAQRTVEERKMQSPRIALNLMMPPVRDRFPCDIKALGLRIWRDRIAELLRGVNQGSTFVRKQNAARNRRKAPRVRGRRKRIGSGDKG